MDRIAFLDLHFHQERTGSSRFFIDLLAKQYRVDIFTTKEYLPDTLETICVKKYDIVICWQTDYCAPYFLAKGLRVVCIPMYDQTYSRLDYYWKSMEGASFINFSKRLHQKIQSFGFPSLYLKYYINPEQYPRVHNFEKLRYFFWMRHPDKGIGIGFLKRMIKAKNFKHLHIHNAPDVVPIKPLPKNVGSVSFFEKTPDSYFKHLGQANVFISPRFREGIGMATLEAMARGMCVVAHNDAACNEYIEDGVNGILMDYNNPKMLRLSCDEAKHIGERARKSVAMGYHIWLDQEDTIFALLKGTLRPLKRSLSSNSWNKMLDHACMMDRSSHRYLWVMKSLIRCGVYRGHAPLPRLSEDVIFFLLEVPVLGKVFRGLFAIALKGLVGKKFQARIRG